MKPSLARVGPAAVLAVALATTGGLAHAATTPAPSPAATTAAAATSEGAIDAEARLTGSGPSAAWFGGAARRTYVLTVVNNSTEPITDPPLTLTVGKDADPTTVLANPSIGTIAPGQSIQYSLPVNLKAPAFGKYRVKATFTGVGETFTTTATTSSYPWMLFLVGWLLLQPLLLGLYKRRPALEQDDEDPFGTPAPELEPALVGAPVYAAAPAFLPPYEPPQEPAYEPAHGTVHPHQYTALDEPTYAPVDPLGYPPPQLQDHVPAQEYAPVQQYAPVQEYAPVQAPAYADVPPAPEPVPAPVAAPVAQNSSSQLVPDYRPVFGVSDMRAYLDPQGAAGPPAPVTSRVIVGEGVMRPLAQPPRF